MKRKIRLAISRQSKMRNSHGVDVHYYEVYNQHGAGISFGISNIDNPDAVAQSICDAWNYVANEMENDPDGLR